MYLLSALQGQGTSLSALAERHPDGMQAGHELAVVAQHLERGSAHAGHDAHRRGHVGRVGQLHADVGDRRAQRAHREGHDVHGASAHRAAKQAGERLAHLLRVAPVVGGAGVVLVLGADEGPVLDPGHVAGIRAGQVGVGPLGVRELLERARLDQGPAEVVVLLGGAVAPVDRVGFGRVPRPRPPTRGASGGWWARRSSGSLVSELLGARRLLLRRPETVSQRPYTQLSCAPCCGLWPR